MSYKTLNVQQQTFLEKYLKFTLFSGRKDKKITAAYERYLLVEQDFKAKMLALPGEDAEVKNLGGQAAGAMAFKNKGEFDEAAAALSNLMLKVDAFTKTLNVKHDEAVKRYQDSVDILPAEDPLTKVLVQKTTQFLPHIPKDVFSRILALDTAKFEAEQLADEFVKGFETKKQAYMQALVGLPTDDTRVAAIISKGIAPSNTTSRAELPKAGQVLVNLTADCDQLKLTIGGEKTAVLEALAKLKDPAGASPHEKGKMQTLRDAATLALAADCPAPADFTAARKAVQALEKLIRAASQIALLPAGTATKAREAMEAFDAVLGDLEITPQIVTDALAAREQAEADLIATKNAFDDAENLPKSTKSERNLRDAAIAQAERAGESAVEQLEQAESRTAAILGKQMLGEALTVGALAPDAGRPLSDNAAQKIIDAFKTQPEVAKVALDLTQRSANPDRLADALPMMCNNVASQFSDGALSFTSKDYSRTYATQLLKQGDFLGGDYFDGLQSYLDSGKQFEPSVIGDSTGLKERGVTEMRSLALAGAMLDDDGKLDLSGEKLQTVMDQLQFSPKGLANATPVLTQHMLHTLEQLKQGNNGAKASKIINDIKAPSFPPSSDLVGRAVGKGDGQAVTARETRQAVLKALMTPMDQGPVGSCFTTAPARRFREENPIGALTGLTEVATTGKFTSATGVKVPVSKNLPNDENPILRAWEYSIATAAAVGKGSREREILGLRFKNNPAMDKIATLAGGEKPVGKVKAKNAIEMEIQDAFTFAYNPTKKVADANDGSSSTGLYQIIETDEFGGPVGPAIETADQFIEVMTRKILKKLGVDATSPKGIKIAKAMKDDMLVTVTPTPPQAPYKALTAGGYKPWEMGSGGLGLDPARALYGDTVKTTETLATASGNPPPTEGERSKASLLAVLAEAAKQPTKQFQTIGTEGCHEYNALPSEKSLQAMIGATPQETSDNIDRLVQKGVDIANKDLPLDRALALYGKQTQSWIDSENNPTAKQARQDAVDLHRPTSPLKPAALKTRILAANKIAMDQLATAEGGTQKEIDERKVSFANYAEGKAMNELAIDLAPPQVVYADTNWGDGASHTFFVMMPDPTTGELRMWKRTDPPGDLSPMARETWVDKGMDITQ